MKLDIKMSKRNRIYRSVCRTLTIIAGVAGLGSAALADDYAGLPDPTQPPYSGAVAGTGTVTKSASKGLQSTFISANQRRAVINGRSYGVGDSYAGGTITDIQPYEVVWKKADRETRLRLLPKLAKEMSVVKVPANSQEGGNHK